MRTISVLVIVMVMTGSSNAGQGPAVAGHVYTPGGEAAKGATVWLVTRYYPDDQQVAACVQTDKVGHFVIEEVADDLFGERAYRSVVARDAEHRLGWVSQFEQTDASDLRINLLETLNAEGKLVDTNGEPIRDDEIKVQYFVIQDAQTRPANWVVLFPELESSYTANTGADGRFVLNNVPNVDSVAAEVVTKGHGTLTVQWKPAELLAIELERAGRLAGKLEIEDDAVSPESVKLQCRYERPRTRAASDGNAPRPSVPDVVVKPDGTFEIDGLVPGRYSITELSEGPGGRGSILTEPVEVKSGETTSGVVVTIRKKVAVRGRVVDGRTGAGVPDVTVGIGVFYDSNRMRVSAGAKTDSDGYYVGRVNPGNVMVMIEDLPEQFLPPRREAGQTRMEAKQDIEWPAIELRPAVTVQGVVIDDAGDPVSGVDIGVAVTDDPFLFLRRGRLLSAVTQSATDGSFSIPQLDPTDTIPFRARSATATTDGAVVVTPGESTGPLRLVISKKNAYRLKGRVVDGAHQPIIGAAVEVQWQVPGFRRQLDTAQTDSNGYFETNALWPGDEYQVHVAMEGYAATESATFKGVAGQTEDLGTIVLGGASRMIAGRVVDTAGNPLADVNVFNAGDAARRVETRTSANGAFVLENLYDGPVYVFVEKPGFRFTAQRLGPADRGPVTITLPKRDEAIPPTANAKTSYPTFEEQQELARKLLEQMWTMPVIRDSRYAQLLVQYMARVDLDTAGKWSEQLDGAADTYVQIEMAKQMAARDVDQTLAALSNLSDRTALALMRQFVREASVAAPERALRYAEEAVVRARALDEPGRSAELARVGKLVAAIGRKDVGRALVEEAAGTAESFNAEGDEGQVRGVVAEALAPFDMDRALRLIDSNTEESYRDRYLSRIAMAVASRVPGKAMELLDTLNSPYLPEHYKSGIVYYAAPNHQAQALEIVETITDPSRRALALGWAAVAIAPQDRKRAHELIDRGMALLRGNDSGVESSRWNRDGGAAALAARLALQAHEIGYPEVEQLGYQALSMRPAQEEVFSVGEWLRCNVKFAMILAMTNPHTARQLLGDLEPRWNRMDPQDYWRGDWLVAWALADPARACQMVTDRLKDYSEDSADTLYQDGVLSVVDVLTTPPEKRHMRRNQIFLNTSFWFPDEEF